MTPMSHVPSKSQQMRAVAAQFQAEGKSARPKDVIAALAKRGIVVSSGHASVVLRKFSGKCRRRRAGRAAAPAAPVARKHVETHDVPSWLPATAAFVKSCGGLDQAIGRLAALEEMVTAISAK